MPVIHHEEAIYYCEVECDCCGTARYTDSEENEWDDGEAVDNVNFSRLFTDDQELPRVLCPSCVQDAGDVLDDMGIPISAALQGVIELTVPQFDELCSLISARRDAARVATIPRPVTSVRHSWTPASPQDFLAGTRAIYEPRTKPPSPPPPRVDDPIPF